jgi:general stress protein 26
VDERSPRSMIWQYVRNIGTCMMVTHGDEHMVARPMRGIIRPEQNAIWFFTDGLTHKEADITRDPRACLTFADQKSETYVSLAGRIMRVADKETINDLWTEEAAAYFPKGPDDPAVVLLKFEAETGEYWNAPSSPIVWAIKFLEAKVTGKRPSLGANETARLS